MSAALCFLPLAVAAGSTGPESIGPGSAHPGSAHAEPAFVETVIKAPMGVEFAMRDFSGDGRMDLLRVEAGSAAVCLMQADGSYGTDWKRIEWPSERLGWDLSDFDGDGVYEIAMLVDGTRLRVHRVGEDGSIGEGEDLLEVASVLPVGVHRVHFARDVDGDGRADLVVPGAGVHRIHLATDEGWAAPIEVVFEVRLDVDVGDPESLSSTFGQRVRVPWFQLKDVDGDGQRDLISRTRERVAFHLASPELASEPTWVLDLEALRDELPDNEGIDFDNLLAAVENRVSWRIADLDGEGANDLIVALGPKFRIYRDGARTGPVGAPDQVLKSSGNVLYSLVRQVEGSEYPDLQILRGERISLGRVLRTLILPSALNFDVFTYENGGGSFSKKPTRRNRITIEIPRLLSFIDEAEGMGKKLEEQFDIPARRLPRVPGELAEGDDVADIAGQELVVYSGRAPEPLLMEHVEGEGVDAEQVERLLVGFFLEELDERGDGASRTFDFGSLAEQDLATGAILRRACAGAEPALRHRLASEAGLVSQLVPRDLDGDGISDVIVVGERGTEWVLQFLVRR